MSPKLIPLVEIDEFKERQRPVVVRPNRCMCGCWSAREAHRHTFENSEVSIMYECVECGEYRV